jgi:hypothetical protein
MTQFHGYWQKTQSPAPDTEGFIAHDTIGSHSFMLTSASFPWHLMVDMQRQNLEDSAYVVGLISAKETQI